ncbi:MAG: ATP-binding protein [Planctomycetaceae bacterium]
MARVEQFEFQVSSQAVDAQSVQERVIAALERLEYTERDVFGTRLALEEAVVNAMKHGNRMDPGKRVTIGCRVDSDVARFEIEDEGPGFCPDSVPDPTADENLDKPSGRGIMLMRAFMNVVEFNERGNRVVMEKWRGAAVEATSASPV